MSFVISLFQILVVLSTFIAMLSVIAAAVVLVPLFRVRPRSKEYVARFTCSSSVVAITCMLLYLLFLLAI